MISRQSLTRTSESKELQQLIVSRAALNLKLLERTHRNTDRNFKFAALVWRRRPIRHRQTRLNSTASGGVGADPECVRVCVAGRSRGPPRSIPEQADRSLERAAARFHRSSVSGTATRSRAWDKAADLVGDIFCSSGPWRRHPRLSGPLAAGGMGLLEGILSLTKHGVFLDCEAQS